MTAYSMVALLGMLLVRYLAKRFALAEVQPWKPARAGSTSKTRLVESHS
jgi:hypothetical protein